MRTIIEIPESQLSGLAELSKREGCSRAEAIRRAIALYLAAKVPSPSFDDQTFGMWKNRNEDSLTYEDQLRAEWDR